MFLIPTSWYRIKTKPQKGRGVFAAHDIPAGTVIGDYLGIIIKPDSNDEKTDGLYDMSGGRKYDIAADPKRTGVHLVNHSCANNCDMYPYQGHMLMFALRKIFSGEELSLSYWLYAPYEKETTCNMHACYCGSAICTGSMHHAAYNFDAWEKLIKREFGPSYNKIPGRYGDELAPLKTYPSTISFSKQRAYAFNLYGAENKSPEKCNNGRLPSLTQLKNQIRETGRQLSFSKLRLTVYGIRDDMLIARNQ